MDQEKIAAMAAAAEKGYEVQFDSQDEAKAVGDLLRARSLVAGHGQVDIGNGSTDLTKTTPQPPKQNPAQFITNKDSLEKGMTPGIVDYAPVLKTFDPHVHASNEGGAHLPPAYDTKWSKLHGKEKDDFILTLSALPEKERIAILNDFLKMNYQREIEKNLSDRKAAQQADPTSYGVGQNITGLGLAAATGGAAGPGVVPQMAAGMISSGMMDPSPKSILAGAAAGAAGGLLAKGITKPIRNTGNALANPKLTDPVLLDWAGMDSDKLLALEANGDSKDILDVLRAHSSVKGPQAMRQSIEGAGVARGAEGTHVNPLQEYPQKIGQIPATMDPMPVQSAAAMHQNSWMKPSGASRYIDLDLGPGNNELAAANGEPDLYQNASSQDLNNIMPAHPGADAALAPRGRPIPPPGPQSVNLDVMQTGPDVPPLSPPEREASAYLGRLADKGLGLTHQTPGGWMNRQMANRVAPAIGFTVPKLGEKMLQMLDSPALNTVVGGIVAGASSEGREKLKRLINAVSSSQNPELEDYLAREMSPEYNTLALEAKDAIDKEKAGQ